jgi:translation initiation factor IF-2
MATMRVFELAKKLQVTSKELLAKLKEMRIDASSHMASLKDADVNKIEKSFVGEKKKAPVKRAKAKPKAKAAPKAKAGTEAEAKPKTATKKPVKTSATKKKAATTKPSKKTSTARTRTATKGKAAVRPKPQRKGIKPAITVKEPPVATVVEEPAQKEVRRTKAPSVERPRTLEIDEATTVRELAEKMDIKLNDLILELMDNDVLASKNQVLDVKTITHVAQKHGFAVILPTSEEDLILAEEEDDPAMLKPKAPVVTLMGHVDHGKTSLLDTIRKSNVVGGESGGITQHIGAYEVTTPHGRVVFLDTPGHEAFTAMRARGAQVTDIVVLVVAADDGVMPQTSEAVNHARAADVAIVVAINKMDKPNAGPDKVRQQLMQLGLATEGWGGHTIAVEVSAKTGQGLDQLLEMLLLEAEMLDFKANPSRRARGVVLESKLDKGRGAVATVLVKNGTLKVGDPFVAGAQYGKVRALFNDRGESVKEAGPATPVEVLGFAGLPEAGDQLVCAAEEKKARQISELRKLRERAKMVAPPRRITLDDLYDRIQEGELAQLNVIIKGDVHGSVDVLVTALEKLSTEEVKLNALHAAVGGINESDVLLASASDAIILGYHVIATPQARKMAEDHGVDIRTYRVIYEAVDAVKGAMEGLLKPHFREEPTARVEVRQIFKISRVGTVAGCYVLEGEITRGQQARLVRDAVIVHEGRISTLRRFKQDARNVQAGYECGLTFENFRDIHVNDIVEAYKVIEEARKL